MEKVTGDRTEGKKGGRGKCREKKHWERGKGLTQWMWWRKRWNERGGHIPKRERMDQNTM